jgi:long-subunit fatty acid transport protein
MKRFTISSLILLVTSVMMLPQVFAQTPDELIPPDLDKRAQTGLKFLSVSIDARAAALGDALTAIDNLGAVAMFYNPASMSRLNRNFDVTFGQVKWIGDINYNAGAAAFRTSYGVFGLNFTTVDYGEFIGTVRDNSVLSNYRETGDFSPSALAVGVGYAYAVSDKFSVGAGARWVSQDLTGGTSTLLVRAEGDDPEQRATFEESTMAFDFGIQYRTGFKSMVFAMSVRNFSQEVTYVQQSLELPLAFNIGLAMDLMDFTSMDREIHSFMLSLDTIKPRDFSSQIRVGGEYSFMDLLHLRAGYVSPTDEQGILLGAGVSKDLGNIEFALDYAYTDFGLFDTVNRFSAHLSF